MSRSLLALALTLLLPLPTRAADPPTLVPLTRWALVVGANDGGGDRTRLRFAGADAQAFADVMTGLGGIDRSHAVILREPSVAAVRAGIADLGRRLSATPGTGRVEVLFYYSGHSDEQGLLLAGERTVQRAEGHLRELDELVRAGNPFSQRVQRSWYDAKRPNDPRGYGDH
jgi:hypothetical protein